MDRCGGLRGGVRAGEVGGHNDMNIWGLLAAKWDINVLQIVVIYSLDSSNFVGGKRECFVGAAEAPPVLRQAPRINL